MKTITKTTKAIFVALLAMILCVAMAFALTACNNDDDKPAPDGITKYDATFDASIVMGAMGSQSFSSIFSDAYVTKNGDKYTLTVIFTAGELTVGAAKGTIFVDDAPTEQAESGSIANGTLGVYKQNGDLVTEGVKVTYSSGNNFAVNPAQENVYYVQSAAFPVDGLRAEYYLTLYINSNMMGAQFTKGVHDAKLTLDLESGNTVTSITGLGVETRGEVPAQVVEPVENKYTEYAANIEAVVGMGTDVDFTENLFDGAYVIKKSGKYEMTLIFKSGTVNMPFGNTMTGFLTSADSEDYNHNIVTPVFGYYNGETLVKDGVDLTYSSEEDYVAANGENYYYVKSMTFTVDELKDSYELSIYVMAGNESSASSMQFPYTKKGGDVCKAILTLDLTDAQKVDSITDLLGVDELGEAPAPEVVYTKYDANLSCYVTAMGGVEFGTGLLSGVYVEKDKDQYYMTLVFAKSQVTIFTVTCDTFIDTDPANAGTSKGVTDGTIGYYKADGTLVTDGVEVGYSSGDDYATSSSGNVYYVKSVTMPIDTLRSEYKLTLYVNSSVMGMQFCEPNDTVQSGTYSAVLTLDLENSTEVDNIDDLIGVPVRGEVPEPQSAYTKYDASLSCVVTVMNADIATGIVDSVYVSKENGKTYMTVIFKKGQATVMTITCDTYIDAAPANAGTNKGVTDGTIGFYKADGTLVTDGIALTYSSGDDYGTDGNGNKSYYVKSATFEIDSLRSEYKLAIYVNSNVMGAQFCEPNDNATTTYSAILTVDMESGEGVDSIDSLLGVETKGEVVVDEG